MSLKQIEIIVNRLLTLDEESASALAKYSGRSVGIKLVNTGVSFTIAIKPSGVRLTEMAGTDPDVCIRGTPLGLLSYILAGKTGGVPNSGGIEISGDVGLAQNVQSIVKNLEFDWEEQLAQWMGDSLAHKAGNIIRRSSVLLDEMNTTIKNDISEYLRYESEMIMDRSEIEDFNVSVDALRNDVERLKLRISRLQVEGKP